LNPQIAQIDADFLGNWRQHWTDWYELKPCLVLSPEGAACDSPVATPWVSVFYESSPEGAKHQRATRKHLKFVPIHLDAFLKDFSTVSREQAVALPEEASELLIARA